MDNLANRITNLSPEQLAQLTKHLQKKRQGSSIPVQPRDKNTFPLSFSQQRLWLLHQLQPESPFYHLPSSIRIDGPLDISILEQSLTALCERHEPLRTVFKFDGDGEPVQVIQPVQQWILDCVDLQDLGAEQQQQQIDHHTNAIAKDPFDLATGPLLRSRLLQLGTDRYILCLCLHHIIADGWALGIIIRELTALYEAFQAKRPNPLPTLSIQYVDYGVWQRDWLAGENSQRHIQYWQQQLQGAPTVLELPTDYPRPPVQSTQGGRQAVALGPELTSALKALGQDEGATLFMTVLAAFNVLLYRYTEQTDLVVGAPVANRNQAATEQLIGVLINTLALRTQLEPDSTFRQLLQQVRDGVIEANAHQDLPFEKLVDVLQPERSRSYAPLLQVLLTVQSLPFQTYTCGDLTIQPEPVFTGTTQFDLVLNLGESASGLHGWLEYNTDIFAAETIQRLVNHLTEILTHSVAAPDTATAVSVLPLLTAQERQLMEEWNHTQADYPRNQTVHQLIAAQVEKTPDAIALILGSEQLSYRDLDLRANQLAHILQEQGVRLETLVGVCVSRSMDMVIAILAILKTGGAYVPLDPKYPKERLQFMLKDSQVAILLTQTHLLESLPESDAEVICLDNTFTGQSSFSLVDVTADNLAYVIYTSGSTGKPKGVLNTHGGLCNLTAVQQRCFKAGVGSRVLQFSSPSFDASIWAIFMALTSGATLVLATSTDLIPGENLEQTFITHKISHVLLPPSVLPFLRAERLSALQHMIVGGEACSLELAHQWSPYCQFWNAYGPTEATVCSTLARLNRQSEQLTIGGPLSNVQTYILDSKLQPVPIGVPGELHIGGVGLARGYLNRPELTEQKFIANPFGEGRLYKTGDRVRYLANGEIEFLGRIDFQVKLRGFRIELGEIEAVLNRQQQVKNCVVVAHGDGQPRLIAYVVGDQDLAIDEIRRQLKQELPDYMVPGWIVLLDALPLTPNGKVDRQALPAVDSTVIAGQTAYVKPSNTIEKTLVSIWESVLQVENVGINNNFFDLGGNSLLLVQAHAALQEQLQIKIPIVELFGYPTIKELSDYLTHRPDRQNNKTTGRKRRKPGNSSDIAIVAMTGRFPDAQNVDQFWQNLKNGVESVSFFSDDELLEAGVEPALLENPNYVKANPVLDDIDLFDAAFFDISTKEAEILDPQQRLFLECAWETLEQAGYDPQRYSGAIGVYAGLGINGYLLNNLIHRRDLLASLGNYRMVLASDKDFLPTRVAYKLNLTGAAINVQTACSTSLVAVHLACQSLINGETDMVIAGGASIRIPHKSGYLYQEGMILSPDGHCRAFDANAAGTVGGSGVAVVMLKRLEDAIADGDHCYAVIKGSAINNDGSLKVGYTAPSIEGQAAVIEEALAAANIEPESIGYIETHGTGTPLGDPIEIAALNRAFQQQSNQQHCAIGSLKTNVGHLDSAAGAAGLIKAALSLDNQLLLPSLNFASPNPQTELDSSPFYVNTELKDWPQTEFPRRAGVSSFGIGGTNAHVILEEAPEQSPSGSSRPWQPLLLSAKTASALDQATRNLVQHLQQQPELNLADVAYTLSCGRQAFAHRRMVVCQDSHQAIEALSDLKPVQGVTQETDSSVAFLFPGQGAQHINMGLDLYQNEPIFRQQVDHCAEKLQPLLNLDLRQVLYPQSEEETAEKLQQTAIAQPALFVIEYALAQLWLAWGIEPNAMLGHSIGEYVAACLAGVFTLEEGLALVAARGQLMQQLPAGAMLSVPMSLEQVQTLLSERSWGGEIAIAVLNEPNRCVVSGSTSAIEALQQHLDSQTIESRRLHTSHAFHSPMMEPIMETFRQRCRQVNLQPPQIPYLSNLTGTWITTDQATDPDYWAQHLRQTVRFSQGVTQLCQDISDNQILLEVGPGRTLSSLAKRHPVEQSIIASMRHPKETKSDQQTLLSALGQLWLGGAAVNWSAFYTTEQRHRIPLPTYPFERQRYWLEPVPADSSIATKLRNQRQPLADWFYLPTWKRRPLTPKPVATPLETVLVFVDDVKAQPLIQQLEQSQKTVIQVAIGNDFKQLDQTHYRINPKEAKHYDQLLQALEQLPQKIAHLWTLPVVTSDVETEQLEQSLNLGFYSLLYLAKAWAKQGQANLCDLVVVTQQLQNVTGEDPLTPANATLMGPIQTIPKEVPGLNCRCVDIANAGLDQQPALVDHLVAELEATVSETAIAYRSNRRWVQDFEPFPLATTEHNSGKNQAALVRHGGVYLITGGLGGLGLSIAQHLSEKYQPKLILLGRSPFPTADTWDDYLANHPSEDPVSSKIRSLQALEANGAEVYLVTADVSHLDDLKTAIASVVKQSGPIQGVLHAAGVPGGSLITFLSREEADTVMAPKLQGTYNLDQALADQPLDFVVLFSSLTAIAGAVGQVDYCAANAFLNTYADHRNQNSTTRYLAINWDSLQRVGMAVEAINQLKQRLGEKNHGRLLQQMETELTYGVLPQESGDVVERLLQQPEPWALVATRPLNLRLAELARHLSDEQDAGLTPLDLGYTPGESISEDQVEAVVMRIFQTLLGTEQLGLNDNFFELGGDSLIGTQLLFHLRQAFAIDLPIATVFDTPTIGQLVEVIKEKQQLSSSTDELDKLSDLLDQLDQLEDLADIES